jgi:hypothetical protein
MPAFSDANEGALTCIKETVEGAASLTALECCDNSPVKWLQKCRCVGQILDMDIWEGHINILWLPWDIIKDKEGRQC